MENIIFLDIDGVINDNFNEYVYECHMALLKLINIYNAKVVVISSNIGNGTLKRKNKIMKMLNDLYIYNIDFIDPNFECFFLNIKVPNRTIGIIDYLRNNRNVKYIIIDDEFSRQNKYFGLNHYKTSWNIGLRMKDLKNIEFKPVHIKQLELFDNLKYNYKTLGDYELVTNKLVKVLKLIKNQKEYN